jgi:hypothetical protein
MRILFAVPGLVLGIFSQMAVLGFLVDLFVGQPWKQFAPIPLLPFLYLLFSCYLYSRGHFRMTTLLLAGFGIFSVLATGCCVSTIILGLSPNGLWTLTLPIVIGGLLGIGLLALVGISWDALLHHYLPMVKTE